MLDAVARTHDRATCTSNRRVARRRKGQATGDVTTTPDACRSTAVGYGK
jgi:hypothetical protein